MAQNPTTLFNDTVQISKGEYFGTKFRGPVDGIVEISLTVRNGPKVDLFLTDERGYQNYAAGRQFREYKEAPTTSVKEATIQKRSSGKIYALIVENNGSGGLLSGFSRKASKINLNILSVS